MPKRRAEIGRCQLSALDLLQSRHRGLVMAFRSWSRSRARIRGCWPCVSGGHEPEANGGRRHRAGQRDRHRRYGRGKVRRTHSSNGRLALGGGGGEGSRREGMTEVGQRKREVPRWMHAEAMTVVAGGQLVRRGLGHGAWNQIDDCEPALLLRARPRHRRKSASCHCLSTVREPSSWRVQRYASCFPPRKASFSGGTRKVD